MCRFGLLVVIGLASACTSKSEAVPVVAPDGRPALHVSCATDDARCYQLAGRACPLGYDMTRTLGPPGNFLVHCRPSGAPETGLAPPPLATADYAIPPLAPSPYEVKPEAGAYPPLAPGGTRP